MTLLELGEALRQAREHRNLSQDDIAVRLKLTSTMVQSIEAGKLEGLPHLVYARGFIKAYASMMGIPADALHDAFEPLEEKEEAFEPVRTRKDWMPIHKDFTFSAGKALILFVLAVIFLVFWFRQPILDTLNSLWPAPPAAEKTEPAPKTPGLPSAPIQAQPASETAQPSQQAATEPSLEAPSLPMQTVAALPAQQAEPQPAGTAEIAPAPAPRETHDTPPQAEPQHHVIVLSARSTCWVSARPSNGPSKNVTLKKGDQLTLTFDEKMTLKFGNMGGVDITFDGTPLPPQGISGQVKSLTFPLAD